jgi:hypothetical protein
MSAVKMTRYAPSLCIVLILSRRCRCLSLLCHAHPQVDLAYVLSYTGAQTQKPQRIWVELGEYRDHPNQPNGESKAVMSSDFVFEMTWGCFSRGRIAARLCVVEAGVNTGLPLPHSAGVSATRHLSINSLSTRPIVSQHMPGAWTNSGSLLRRKGMVVSRRSCAMFQRMQPDELPSNTHLRL